MISTHSNDFENHGLYLIDNGFAFIIYIKQDMNKDLAVSLFGTNDYSQIEFEINEENVFANPDDNKSKIISVIEYLRGTKSFFQNLIFVFEGTPGDRLYVFV